MSKVTLFSGNADINFAKTIAKHLKLSLGKALVGRFNDGEIQVEIQENVRGHDVFIIQSTCNPVNENLMELIIMADALRRASANKITAIIPYFGYARQDRRVRSARVPISAKVVADMIAAVGITRILTVDLHADQIQGFFLMPVDNIYATPFMLEDLRAKKYPELMVVSPDVGGVIRARATAKLLNDADLAIIDKRRYKANQSEVMHVIGDVAGRSCVLVDDMVDTGGTLCHAADALKERGAERVVAYCTHAVLSGNAVEQVNESMLDEVVVTDTIPLNGMAAKSNKIRQITLSKVLANVIDRLHNSESISSMFPA